MRKQKRLLSATAHVDARGGTVRLVFFRFQNRMFVFECLLLVKGVQLHLQFSVVHVRYTGHRREIWKQFFSSLFVHTEHVAEGIDVAMCLWMISVGEQGNYRICNCTCIECYKNSLRKATGAPITIESLSFSKGGGDRVTIDPSALGVALYKREL